MSFKNRHANAPDIKVHLENACGVILSARTDQMWLVECRLLAYRPKKKPLPTKNEAEATFKQHVSWIMDQ